MKDFFDMIFESPMRAFAFLLMLACVALVEVLRRQFFARLNSYEDKMRVYDTTMGKSLTETRVALTTHSKSLDKVSRTIAEDALKVKENILSIKEDLLERTAELEKYSRELEHRTSSLSHVFEKTVDNFDAKLAHIVNLRRELEGVHGRVQKLDEHTGQFRIMVGKLGEQVSTISKVLKKHDDELRKKKE